MTRTEFETLAAGTPVTIYAFGVHPGVVIATNPTVTIQNRTFEARGWVTVRPSDPRTPIFNGTFKDVDVVKQIAAPPRRRSAARLPISPDRRTAERAFAEMTEASRLRTPVQS